MTYIVSSGALNSTHSLTQPAEDIDGQLTKTVLLTKAKFQMTRKVNLNVSNYFN